jgi:hypothetical protein
VNDGVRPKFRGLKAKSIRSDKNQRKVEEQCLFTSKLRGGRYDSPACSRLEGDPILAQTTRNNLREAQAV